jgi:hypothetical protein
LGQERLVFRGGTAINNPPRHNALYSNWRRSSNGEASRIARFNPDLALTGDFGAVQQGTHMIIRIKAPGEEALIQTFSVSTP